MDSVFKSLIFAFVASSCLAMHYPSGYLDADVDQIAEKIKDSLAVRMLQGDTEINPLLPIPEKARRLGLTTLVSLLETAGLNESLSTESNLTLFGPSNLAFTKLPDWVKQAIKNTTVITDILKFHVLPTLVKSGDLKNELLVASVQGQKIRINIFEKKGEDRTVYTAQCAPLEAARVDQQASNGVIHVLQRVMIPPAGNAAASLKACPEFKTLTRAVMLAGLTGILRSSGPFTVFAPTDDAFKKLPPETIKKLFKDRKALANILKYHVVPGTLCTSGMNTEAIKTLQGQDIHLKATGDIVKVNNAKVISPDGSVTNGVVHAIDTVLIPPSSYLV